MNHFNKKDFLAVFIDKWRELPVLWATKDPRSRNREQRKAALNSLLPFVRRQVGPQVTAEQLDTRIGTLRGSYRKERNKVLDSMRSGAGQVYKPSLWYYSRLSFLDDHLEVRESLFSLPPRQRTSRSSLPFSLPCSQPDPPSEGEPSQDQEEPSILEEQPDLPTWSPEDIIKEEGQESAMQEEARVSGTEEVAGPSGTEEVAGPSSSTRCQMPPIRLQTRRARRDMRVSEVALGLIREAQAFLQQPTTIEESYGSLVMAKMGQMSEEQRLLFEPLLISLLNKGVRGLITEDTVICSHGHPPPPAIYQPPHPHPPPSHTSSPPSDPSPPPYTSHTSSPSEPPPPPPPHTPSPPPGTSTPPVAPPPAKQRRKAAEKAAEQAAVKAARKAVRKSRK